MSEIPKPSFCLPRKICLLLTLALCLRGRGRGRSRLVRPAELLQRITALSIACLERVISLEALLLLRVCPAHSPIFLLQQYMNECVYDSCFFKSQLQSRSMSSNPPPRRSRASQSVTSFDSTHSRCHRNPNSPPRRVTPPPATPSFQPVATTTGAVAATVSVSSLPPYNAVLTKRWLMVVPRSRREWGGLDVNGMGFLGALLVREREKAGGAAETEAGGEGVGVEAVRGPGALSVLEGVTYGLASRR